MPRRAGRGAAARGGGGCGAALWLTTTADSSSHGGIHLYNRWRWLRDLLSSMRAMISAATQWAEATPSRGGSRGELAAPGGRLRQCGGALTVTAYCRAVGVACSAWSGGLRRCQPGLWSSRTCLDSPEPVQTVSRQRPDSVQTASRQRPDSGTWLHSSQ